MVLSLFGGIGGVARQETLIQTLFGEERRVIPIIGPELLKVETETGTRLLYDWVAEKLASKLSVDTRELPQPYTLNDVVCWSIDSTQTTSHGSARASQRANPLRSAERSPLTFSVMMRMQRTRNRVKPASLPKALSAVRSQRCV